MEPFVKRLLGPGVGSALSNSVRRCAGRRRTRCGKLGLWANFSLVAIVAAVTPFQRWSLQSLRHAGVVCLASLDRHEP